MSTCEVCGGTGTCIHCYGSGKRYDGAPCNYCEKGKCSHCGGSGEE